MMDLQPTPFLVATNIIAIVFLGWITYTAFRRGRLTKTSNAFSIVLIFAFCLFSFWGKDWFGYLSCYNDVKSGIPVLSIEDIYIWLMKVSPNYIVFRLIVWGAGLVILFKTISLTEVNRSVSLFFFCVIYLIWFSYARVSLCMAVLFCGLAVLVSRSNRTKGVIKNILGLAFVFVAFYLHKSSMFGIAVVFLVLILRKLKKGAAVLSLLLFPVVVFLVSRYLPEVISGLGSGETDAINEYLTAGSQYLERDRFQYGLGVIIEHLLERLPYYLLTIACIRALLSKAHSIPPVVTSFMIATIILVLGASVFLYDFGMNTAIVYTRFIRFAMIPSLISLSFLYENGIYRRLVQLTYRIAIVGCAYSLLYAFYNVYIG